MSKIITKFFILLGILTAVFGAAYFVTRFLLSTDISSGTDEETRNGVRHEPLRRKYTRLI